jgi:hypothetical protein
MTSSAIASVFLFGLILQAAEIKPPAPDPLKVCVTGHGEFGALTQAQEIASHIFARIGIHIDWYHDDRHCKNPLEEFINVLVSADAPANQHPDALAYTRLYDHPHIEVFYNRVANTVDPLRVPALLGHVLAHEIGHTLEGTASHTETGLMKARWDEYDLLRLSFHPMSFTSADVSLIYQGIAQRSAP